MHFVSKVNESNVKLVCQHVKMEDNELWEKVSINTWSSIFISVFTNTSENIVLWLDHKYLYYQINVVIQLGMFLFNWNTWYISYSNNTVSLIVSYSPYYPGNPSLLHRKPSSWQFDIFIVKEVGLGRYSNLMKDPIFDLLIHKGMSLMRYLSLY